MKSVDSRELFAFVHIEKAAGTTLIHYLRRRYFPRYADVRPLVQSQEKNLSADDLSLFLRICPWARIIGGHSIVPWSDLSTRFPNIRFFTILRDPVQRYVSQYRYWTGRLDWKLSFEEFLERPDTHNVQTRKLCGSSDAEAAINMLKDRFSLVGTVDQFDRFIERLSALLPFPGGLSAYETRNTASSRGRQSALSESLLEEAARRNAADVRVYEWAKSFDRADVPAIPAPESGAMPKQMIPALDYLLRHGYLLPATSLTRVMHGLPRSGSYRRF